MIGRIRTGLSGPWERPARVRVRISYERPADAAARQRRGRQTRPVPTLSIINLDSNATTRPCDAAVAAVERALREVWHNPSSVHRAGQGARREIELAREKVAALIGAAPRDIVFTSGGTESIDLAIRGVLAAWRPDRTHERGGASTPGPSASAHLVPSIITSRVEHACVRDLVEELEKLGRVRVRWASLLPGGVVDPASVAAQIDTTTALVCVQWANNETGAVQPLREIGEACRERRVSFLCDGVQWVGKCAVRVGDDSPFDLLAISAHKLHGPKGVGALWIRPGTKIRPVIHGTQELGRRGGTENVPGIAGFGAAAEESARWLVDASCRDAGAALRDRFEQRILSAFPDASINGPNDPPGVPADARARLWNTTNIAFPRLEAEALLLLLSERGVWASAGAACSSGSLDPSPVLLAMGVPEERAHGSLRFSISRCTTQDEVDRAAEIVLDCVRRLSRSMTA